jgi:hypothetical protein
VLLAASVEERGMKEAWRAKGAAFFQGRGRKGSGAAAIDGAGAAPEPGATLRVEARSAAPIRRAGSCNVANAPAI